MRSLYPGLPITTKDGKEYRISKLVFGTNHIIPIALMVWLRKGGKYQNNTTVISVDEVNG